MLVRGGREDCFDEESIYSEFSSTIDRSETPVA